MRQYLVYRDFEPKGLFVPVMCELWKGLPSHLSFVEVRAKKGEKALRATGVGIYVWISPDTTRALRENPDQVLCALGRRQGQNMDFFHVTTGRSDTVIKIVEATQRFNAGQIAQAQKTKKKDRI